MASTDVFTLIVEGKKEALRGLIDEDPSLLEARSEHKDTPLMVAISKQKHDITKMLLDMGANVEASNFEDMTPLIYATFRRDGESICALLDRGASINRSDVFGLNPLLYSIDNGGSIDTLTLMLQRGADINYQDLNGYSALMYTALNTDGIDEGRDKSMAQTPADKRLEVMLEMMVLLLRHGADASLKNSFGKDALGLTSNKRAREILGRLDV